MSLTLEHVRAAERRLAGIALRTPVIREAGGDVAYKAECLQRGGSFKIRGAYNRLALVRERQPDVRRVVAVSSGNHGIAVGIAASMLGFEATVLVPADAPARKQALIRETGATLRTFDRATTDREALAVSAADELSAVVVHPYDDYDVMAGQGTVALEMLADVPAPALVLVPMSGGGLMAGCATVVKALAPGARVVGVEPAAANDTQLSLAAGRRVQIDPPATVADALAIRVPGEKTFAVNQQLVDEVVTVSEEQILQAVSRLEARHDLVVEPGGAVTAAALEVLDRPAGTALVLLSGGNRD